MIYFLQCAPDGPIKIGHTDGSIVGRVKHLQGTSPHVLVMLGAHEGNRGVETALHRRFSHYRVRSEWFHPVQPIFDHVAENGGLEAYFKAERPDLKKAVNRSLRKFWPKDLKERYLSMNRRRMGAWQESRWHLEEEYAEIIEDILSDPRISHLIPENKVTANDWYTEATQ